MPVQLLQKKLQNVGIERGGPLPFAHREDGAATNVLGNAWARCSGGATRGPRHWGHAIGVTPLDRLAR